MICSDEDVSVPEKEWLGKFAKDLDEALEEVDESLDSLDRDIEFLEQTLNKVSLYCTQLWVAVIFTNVVWAVLFLVKIFR